MPIRQGEVYWLVDCPPWDGHHEKDRPVIVLSPAAALKQAPDPVLVVACSTTVRETETDRIRVPSKSDTPTCRTGLTRPSWAVPRWYLVVDRDRLGKPVGAVTGQLLQRIVLAVETRIFG